MKKLLLLCFLSFTGASLYAQDTINEEVMNFSIVERVPVAFGCDTLADASNEQLKLCLSRYLINHVGHKFEFPEEARRRNVTGKIYVQFIVERDASVSGVRIIRGIQKQYSRQKKKLQAAKEMEAEAIRVIESLVFLTPAWQKGKPVRISYVMPINAKLE